MKKTGGLEVHSFIKCNTFLFQEKRKLKYVYGFDDYITNVIVTYIYSIYNKQEKLLYLLNEKILGSIPIKNTKCISFRKMSLMRV